MCACLCAQSPLCCGAQIEDDGFGLVPLPPGIEMTRYYVVRVLFASPHGVRVSC